MEEGSIWKLLGKWQRLDLLRRTYKSNVSGMVACLVKAYREERVMILLERSRGAEKRKGPGEGQGVRVVIWDCGNEM